MVTPAIPQLKDHLAARQERKTRELHLWHRWKGGDHTALEPLYKSLSPLITRVTRNYQGNLPEAFVNAEVKKNVFKALHTYDPVKYPGVQLNTHILNTTQKVQRQLYKYQNPARLAEESHLKVPGFQNVLSNMHEELGRPPTTQELAHNLGEKPEEIERLRSGTRRDLSAIEGQSQWQAPEHIQQNSILENISHELNPMERHVLHMTFGMNGHPKLQAKDIAMRLGTTGSRVSQIRREIAQKVEKRYSQREPGMI